jgi:hypothetical protein
MGLLFDGELLFAHAALRTHPVVRQVLKGGSRGDAGVRVADRRVVIIATRITEIPFHEILLSDG